MKLARTRNTVRNTSWGIVYRLITLIGPFVVRTLIVNELGLEYSGLSSLFTSILTVLNLTNLGFSSSIVFNMYKAIADDDIEAQCAMINYYKRVYKIVGVVILIFGIITMPFLPHFVEGDVPSDINLYSLFAIYLFETVLDYFLFAYTTAIFNAYQRNDVLLKISCVRYLAQYLLQAIAIIVTHNYYIYIIILPLMVIPNNIANYYYSRKYYPEIKSEGTISESTRKDILLRVGTLFGHKVGSTALVGIDSILISSFLGLATMGLYGNYYYILTAVNALIEIVTNGLISGIGNKLLLDDKESNFGLFNALTYGWVFLVGWAANSLYNLYQPFIAGIWYSKDYLLPSSIVVVIVIYFYTWMFRIMQLTYRDAAGLWTKDWLKPYVGMVLNVVFSIVLLIKMRNVAAALIPTIFVFIFIYTPWESWTLFKYLFDGSIHRYHFDLLKYTLLNVLAVLLSNYLCYLISPDLTAISFLLRFIILTIIQYSLWCLLTFKTKEFHYLLNYINRFRRKRTEK